MQKTNCNRGTRRACARCGALCPQWRAGRRQLCPRCVLETTDDPERVERARTTLAREAARARAAALHPARAVDPAEEERRQERARRPRPVTFQPAAPAARAAGNVRSW